MSKQTENKIDHDEIIAQQALDAIAVRLNHYKANSVWTGSPAIEKYSANGGSYIVRRVHSEPGVTTNASVTVDMTKDRKNTYSYTASYNEEQARKRIRIKVGGRYGRDSAAFKWRKSETAEQFAERVVSEIVDRLASYVSSEQHRRVKDAQRDIRKELLGSVTKPIEAHLTAAGATGHVMVRPDDGRYDDGHTIKIHFELNMKNGDVVAQLEKIFGLKF